MKAETEHPHDRARTLRRLLTQAMLIVAAAYAVVVIAVYAVPHLPLANRRTFYPMLKAQMTVDRAMETSDRKRELILFLGSSVVERGVAELYMDSLMRSKGIPVETANSGTGGFFATANLPMFRALLERGLKPSRVLYGFFLQELNAKSGVHLNVSASDTADIKLKEKSLWNVVRYGPKSLFPLTDPDGIHKYVFLANNAFREVHDLTMLDKLMFGVNMFERDSSYTIDPTILADLHEIVKLCQNDHIPIALYNTPVRPTVESLADLPYLHRGENYDAIYQLARSEAVPIWNFDAPGLFADSDFQDTYHLTPGGARKITRLLCDRILEWNAGNIHQDSSSTLF